MPLFSLRQAGGILYSRDEASTWNKSATKKENRVTKNNGQYMQPPGEGIIWNYDRAGTYFLRSTALEGACDNAATLSKKV